MSTLSKRRLLLGTLMLMALGLSAGTAIMELTTGLGLAVAVMAGDRRRLGVLAGPLLALGGALLLAAPLGGPGAWTEVIGRVWPLAPLVAVPALLGALGLPARESGDRSLFRVESLGLLAACGPALWGLGQRLAGLEATGPFSHHLTLGYALCVPAAVAAYRGRWVLLAVLSAGILSTGAGGPILSLAVAVAITRFMWPSVGLGLGSAAVLLAVAAGQELQRSDVHQRAVLWTSGAWVALSRPFGAGTGGVRDALDVAQALIEPGFHFPLHAHDSALQLAAVVGLGGWIALMYLGVELWERSDRGGRAILVALALGSLTQDVLGDLEVTRTAAFWLAWLVLPVAGLTGARLTPTRSDEPAAASVVP